jgi:hypothetical protein
MTWSGVAAFTVLLVASDSIPGLARAQPLCLAVSVAGVLLTLVADSLAGQRRGAPPTAPLALRPPGFRAKGTWWPDVHGRRLFAALASLGFPYLLLMLSLYGTPVSGLGALLALGIYAMILGNWALGLRMFKAPGTGTDVLESAMYEGVARALPVTVTRLGGGIHRRPFATDHEPKAGFRKFPINRVPYFSSALILAAPGGERALFLDQPIDAEPLAAAIHGNQGWLYWAHAATGMDQPDWSGPAVLVLSNGRYVRGWTRVSSASVLEPQGETFRSPGCDQQPVVRPLDETLLRKQTSALPSRACFAAAVLCVLPGALSVANSPLNAAMAGGLAFLAPVFAFGGLALSKSLRLRRRRTLREIGARSHPIAPPGAM